MFAQHEGHRRAQEKQAAALAASKEAVISAVAKPIPAPEGIALAELRKASWQGESVSGWKVVFDPAAPDLAFDSSIDLLAQTMLSAAAESQSFLSYLNQQELFWHIDHTNRIQPVRVTIEGTTLFIQLGKNKQPLGRSSVRYAEQNYLLIANTAVWDTVIQFVNLQLQMKKEEERKPYIPPDHASASVEVTYDHHLTESQFQAFSYFLQELFKLIKQSPDFANQIVLYTDGTELTEDQVICLGYLHLPHPAFTSIVPLLSAFHVNTIKGQDEYYIAEDREPTQQRLYNLFMLFLQRMYEIATPASTQNELRTFTLLAPRLYNKVEYFSITTEEKADAQGKGESFNIIILAEFLPT